MKGQCKWKAWGRQRLRNRCIHCSSKSVRNSEIMIWKKSLSSSFDCCSYLSRLCMIELLGEGSCSQSKGRIWAANEWPQSCCRYRRKVNVKQDQQPMLQSSTNAKACTNINYNLQYEQTLSLLHLQNLSLISRYSCLHWA